jgi:hypothetical protein
MLKLCLHLTFYAGISRLLTFGRTAALERSFNLVTCPLAPLAEVVDFSCSGKALTVTQSGHSHVRAIGCQPASKMVDALG